MALLHASFGGCSSLLSTSFRVWNPANEDTRCFPFAFRSVHPPIHSSWTWSLHHPETAVRFCVKYLVAQLDCNRRVGWPEGPARPLVANPWTDHTSIWHFSSRQVERWMSTISGSDNMIAARILRPLVRLNWRIMVTTVVKCAYIRMRIARTFAEMWLLLGWIA